MPTHAELSCKLLRDAATFFRTLGEHNPPLKTQMSENAKVFEEVANILEDQPTVLLDGTPVAELAARLMRDASNFFIELAKPAENEPIREQMTENARVYAQLADLLQAEPLGILD